MTNQRRQAEEEEEEIERAIKKDREKMTGVVRNGIDWELSRRYKKMLMDIERRLAKGLDHA